MARDNNCAELANTSFASAPSACFTRHGMHRYSNAGGNPYPYPSPPCPRPSAGSSGASTPLSYANPASGQQSHRNPPQEAGSQASDDSFPACPNSFPELQRMPLEQIRILLNDSAAFDKFVEEHAHTKRIEAKVSSIKAQIEELEKKNCAKQEELKRLASIDSGKSVEDLLAIETQKYAESTEIYNDWLSRNSRFALNQRLEEESLRLKHDSDAMQQRFLDGDIPHERFVGDYKELRRRYHELMIKLEFEKCRASGAAAARSSSA